MYDKISPGLLSEKLLYVFFVNPLTFTTLFTYPYWHFPLVFFFRPPDIICWIYSIFSMSGKTAQMLSNRFNYSHILSPLLEVVPVVIVRLLNVVVALLCVVVGRLAVGAGAVVAFRTTAHTVGNLSFHIYII